MTTSERIRVEVDLTGDELVTFLTWVAPGSELLSRLTDSRRVRRRQSAGGPRFWFTGTEEEARALLELAITRAPGVVPRIEDAIRLARTKGTE